MGPVDDMARMYQAVLDHIKDDPIKDFNHKTSDQPHFDAVYVKQEQARLSQRPDILEGRYNDTLDMKFGGGERPKALDSGNHELHMGLDYGSSLFLPLLWQEPFLMWAKPSATESFPNASPDERKLLSYFHQPLPQVLQTSPRPFSKLNDTALARRDWSDVSLLHSVATRSIPPVIHFTIDSLRDPWWEKLWFQDTAQAFRLARMREGGAGQEKQRRISQSPIDERHWYNSEHISPSGDKGAAGQNYSLPGAGVWTEEGKWVTWENTCGEYEQWLFV
ncbi:hypothetical protein ANO11243_072030 [Dothideomycetidae sp. 11243]|nr:hypothetical protein ANO11243_072030 [fungal sp. No.11243]